MQGCSPQRGHYPNAAWHDRQSALAGCIKQTFCLKLGFDAQKLLKQSALPGALQAVHNQLQIATLFIHAQLATHFHQFAIARREVHRHGSAAKHGAAQLPCRVFDAEVAVPAACT